jgi:hypothetical protein
MFNGTIEFRTGVITFLRKLIKGNLKRDGECSNRRTELRRGGSETNDRKFRSPEEPARLTKMSLFSLGVVETLDIRIFSGTGMVPESWT